MLDLVILYPYIDICIGYYWNLVTSILHRYMHLNKWSFTEFWFKYAYLTTEWIALDSETFVKNYIWNTNNV